MPTPWVITNNSFVQVLYWLLCAKRGAMLKSLSHVGKKMLADLTVLIRKPLHAGFCSYSHSDLNWTKQQVEFSILFLKTHCQLPKIDDPKLQTPTAPQLMFRKTHRWCWWLFSEVLLAKRVFSCLLVFVYALVYSAESLTGQSRQQLMPSFLLIV